MAMLNPISNAVREVHSTIPKEILKHVFGREEFGSWRRSAPVSIDEMIRSKVIRPRVLKDCNLIGGRMVMISLENLPYEELDDYAVVYNIPLKATGNREIMSVLSVNYLPMDAGGGGGVNNAYAAATPTSMNDVQTVAQRVMDASSTIPHISTASAELIGYNTVIIRDQMRAQQIYTLRCMISNDENLTNLQPRSYQAFSKAVLMATKSFIFNSLDIEIDQGVLEQGQSLGKFRERIDEYKDAEEQYQDYMKTVLRKVFFMNDTSSYDRFISVQLNPGL